MLMLDKNECPYDIPEEIKSRIFSSLSKVELNRYPEPSYLKLKNILANSIGFKSKDIILGNGGDEILWMFYSAYCLDKGSVLTLSPSFSQYSHLAKVFDAQHVELPLKLGQIISIDEESFISKIEEISPSIVILDNPNNPTGFLFSNSFIDKILDVAKCPVMIDEAYGEFAGSTYIDHIRGKKLRDNLIILKTFSKIWGLAGLRVGYAVAGKSIASKLESIRSPFNLNVLSSCIVEEVLEMEFWLKSRIEYIVKAREDFLSFINDKMKDWTAFTSDANFILLKSPMKEEDLKRVLKEEKVALRFPKIDKKGTWVRITIGTKGEMKHLKEIMLRRF